MDLERLRKSWGEVIARIKHNNPMGEDLVRDAYPISIDSETKQITLQFTNHFNVERINGRPRINEIVANEICHVLGIERGSIKLVAVLR